MLFVNNFNMIYFYILIVISCLFIKVFSKYPFILKTRLHYKRVNLKGQSFFNKAMNLTYNLKVPLKDKKFYDHILKCLNYNSPISYSKIDIKLIKNCGIDVNYPIYIEHSPRKEKLKKLIDVKRLYDYNLVIFCKVSELKCYKKFRNIDKMYVLVEREISKSLKENLYKININYKTPKLKEYKEDEGFSFSGLNLKEHFENFCLVKNYYNQDFDININSAKYKYDSFKISLKNKSKITRKITFKFVKLLNKEKLNYYNFSFKNKTIEAYNLLKGTKNFLYCSLKPKHIKYSLVDGQLYSNQACIIVLFEITLKSNEEKSIYICESCENCEDIFNMYKNNILSLAKTFNLQINTQNKQLDSLFNVILPKKIIINGITACKYEHLSICEAVDKYKENKISAFECYRHIKEAFLIEKCENFELLPNNMNYSLKIFFENMSKNISVSHGEKAYLNIDDVLFYNTRIVSKSALKKANGDIEIVF